MMEAKYISKLTAVLVSDESSIRCFNGTHRDGAVVTLAVQILFPELEQATESSRLVNQDASSILLVLSFLKVTLPVRFYGYGNSLISGAGNEIRTRDPNLGKVVLYQLSYSRINMKPKNYIVSGIKVKLKL